MNRPLPSLDAPWPGTTCRTCGEEASALVDFCASCHEREMQRLEAPVLVIPYGSGRSERTTRQRGVARGRGCSGGR